MQKPKLHRSLFLSLCPSTWPLYVVSTTMQSSFRSSKLVHVVIALYSLIALNSSGVFVSALNLGIHSPGVSIQVSKGCSRKCESAFCSVPPLLRYGKYCGLLYSGCPGEKPCDGLDACCMTHDACVQARNNDYLSRECSQKFINCVERFKSAGAHTFKGNSCDPEEVINLIKVVMEAALHAGKVFHKP